MLNVHQILEIYILLFIYFSKCFIFIYWKRNRKLVFTSLDCMSRDKRIATAVDGLAYTYRYVAVHAKLHKLCRDI